MRIFRRPVDPLSERKRALEQELRQLQQQITALDQAAHKAEQLPQERSAIPSPRELPAQNPFAKGHELIFEPVDNDNPKPESLDVRVAHYNELGVKKIDLVQVWSRISAYLKKSPASQSKFVNYLAAGSIQGIAPLRYERRIARNRFLVMFGVLALVLFGILALLKKQL